MTKQELIANTASATNCTQAEAERIIDGMFTVIIEALRTQDRVELRPDFGSFVARRKGSAASLQRDPLADGCTMQRVISFTISLATAFAVWRMGLRNCIVMTPATA